jgi:hypothetical protein
MQATNSSLPPTVKPRQVFAPRANIKDVYGGLRTCPKCKHDYPATTDYFKRYKYSLGGNCKSCRQAAQPTVQPEAPLYLPGADVEYVQMGHFRCLVASEHCRMCDRSFAPYSELWHERGLCAFCHEDIQASLHDTLYQATRMGGAA